MKPINSPERKKAFLNFLVFFTITIFIILIVAFSSQQVPFKDNEKLRRENNKAENEKLLLQRFEVKMDQTANLIDSIILVKNSFLIDAAIEKNMRSMKEMLDDSLATSNFCNKVLINLSTLRAAKNEIRASINSSDEILEKNKEIKDLKDDLRKANERIFELIRSGSKG